MTASKGALILWDSRTMHCNQHTRTDRPYSVNPRVRMVGYLCYVPKIRLTDENRMLRKKAFGQGVATGHIPAASIELKYIKEHVSPGFEQHLEDPNYTQPPIHLTPLGETVLGL